MLTSPAGPVVLPADYLPYMYPIEQQTSPKTQQRKRVKLQGDAGIDSLCSLSVEEVSILLSRLHGLSPALLTQYQTRLHENNISGPVLLDCDLSELKPVMQMTFGDWELFKSLVEMLREQEQHNVEPTSKTGANAEASTQESSSGPLSPKVTFTQTVPAVDVSVPQAVYAGSMESGVDTIDMTSPISTQSSRKHESPAKKSSGGSNQGRSLMRQDSFVGEVMMESEALRGFIDATGVRTDSGGETEDDSPILMHDTILEEEEKTKNPKTKNVKERMTAKQRMNTLDYEKPTVKVRIEGGSDTPDSDQEEMQRLYRKASLENRQTINHSALVPKIKLSDERNMSSHTLDLESDKSDREVSPDKAIGAQGNSFQSPKKQNSVNSKNIKGLLLKIKKSMSRENMNDAEAFPLTADQTFVDMTGGMSDGPESTTSSRPMSQATSIPDLSDTISPTSSFEHLALRKLARTEDSMGPSAFRSVTPPSSVTSSRASSRAQSHSSSVGGLCGRDLASRDSLPMSEGEDGSHTPTPVVEKSSSGTSEKVSLLEAGAAAQC